MLGLVGKLAGAWKGATEMYQEGRERGWGTLFSIGVAFITGLFGMKIGEGLGDFVEGAIKKVFSMAGTVVKAPMKMLTGGDKGKEASGGIGLGTALGIGAAGAIGYAFRDEIGDALGIGRAAAAASQPLTVVHSGVPERPAPLPEGGSEAQQAAYTSAMRKWDSYEQRKLTPPSGGARATREDLMAVYEAIRHPPSNINVNVGSPAVYLDKDKTFALTTRYLDGNSNMPLEGFARRLLLSEAGLKKEEGHISLTAHNSLGYAFSPQFGTGALVELGVLEPPKGLEGEALSTFVSHNHWASYVDHGQQPTPMQGQWTGKYGIDSMAELMHSPQAQAQLLSDWLEKGWESIKQRGLDKHIGQAFTGADGKTHYISWESLLAGWHLSGGKNVDDYLKALDEGRNPGQRNLTNYLVAHADTSPAQQYTPPSKEREGGTVVATADTHQQARELGSTIRNAGMEDPPLTEGEEIAALTTKTPGNNGVSPTL